MKTRMLLITLAMVICLFGTSKAQNEIKKYGYGWVRSYNEKLLYISNIVNMQANSKTYIEADWNGLRAQWMKKFEKVNEYYYNYVNEPLS